MSPSNPKAPHFQKSLRRAAKLILLCLALLAVSLFFYFHLDRYLAISSLQAHENWVREQFSLHPIQTTLVYAVFAAGYVIASLPAASIPMMVAGAIFGPWLGTALASLSLSFGAIVSLLMSRFLFHDFVKARFTKQADIVQREYRRSGVDYLIAMRLIPVMPYFLTNLVFGLTPIPVFRFWVTSLLASMPAIFLYVMAGTELSKIHSASEILSTRLLATLAALAALPFLTRWIIQRVLKLRRPPPSPPSL